MSPAELVRDTCEEWAACAARHDTGICRKGLFVPNDHDHLRAHLAAAVRADRAAIAREAWTAALDWFGCGAEMPDKAATAARLAETGASE